MHGMVLGRSAWSKQQMTRVSTFRIDSVSKNQLEVYRLVAGALPARQVQTRDPKQASWFVPSALRAFLTDNLAHNRPWHEGFADATASDGLSVHRMHPKGALHYTDIKGMSQVSDQLDDKQKVFVESFHKALRQRYAQIASENKSNPHAMKNRMDKMREELRLAFVGAKTLEQVRFTLADLFSRAGRNTVLQQAWQQFLPLVSREGWRTARDLALFALVSYRSGSEESTKTEDAA